MVLSGENRESHNDDVESDYQPIGSFEEDQFKLALEEKLRQTNQIRVIQSVGSGPPGIYQSTTTPVEI